MTSPVSAAASWLVSPAWLAERLGDPALRIVDARLGELYAEGHIPGAVHLDLQTLRTRRDGVEGMLIGPEAFAARMSAAGIGPETTVIAYDDYYGQVAARIAWSLNAYGHDRVALLDGGWDAWEAAVLPISVEAAAPAPARFTAVQNPTVTAEHTWVRAHVGTPPDPTQPLFLDVRSPAEYERGHLPGAIAWNWERGIGGDTTFRPAAELTAELAALGITPPKTIVTYCQSGMRAAHTYVLLRSLGFTDVRMYDGSWAEWSYREERSTHAG